MAELVRLHGSPKLCYHAYENESLQQEEFSRDCAFIQVQGYQTLPPCPDDAPFIKNCPEKLATLRRLIQNEQMRLDQASLILVRRSN
jgi:hypothetical protein